jgi:A/G-specific adenine glycosylase
LKFNYEKKINKEFQKSILNWYIINGRSLPWRDTTDPFKILIAEFLLQKTDVEKVKTVYGKFINQWHSPQALSKARISSISKMIQPLGLRYKAYRLKITSKVIIEKYGGEIPEAEDKLLELPGVGRYIASAVACFAFNKPKAVLDTNIIRILNRVFGILHRYLFLLIMQKSIIGVSLIMELLFAKVKNHYVVSALLEKSAFITNNDIKNAY